jgi:hypothetical protein
MLTAFRVALSVGLVALAPAALAQPPTLTDAAIAADALRRNPAGTVIETSSICHVQMGIRHVRMCRQFHWS